MDDCPCCPGTGIEVRIHEPNGWTTLYFCMSCVGGGYRNYAPGEKVPTSVPRPLAHIATGQLRLPIA